MVVEIKALACERPADLGLPLARLSISEIARVAVARDIVEAISVTTIWRWLSEDGLKPWTYRSWISVLPAVLAGSAALDEGTTHLRIRRSPRATALASHQHSRRSRCPSKSSSSTLATPTLVMSKR